MAAYKRRNYFIDREYQGKVILRIIMICAAGLLLELGIFNYLSYQSMEAMRWRTHISADTLGDITRNYLIFSSLFAIIFTCAALLVYLRITHRRAAGPLYRMKKDIEAAAGGDLSFNIWLRREDDFKDTAHELNKMVTAIRHDFRQLSDGLSAAGRTIDMLEYVQDKPEVIRQKCQQLVECLEPLKTTKQ